MIEASAPGDQGGTWALGDGIIKGDIWITGRMLVRSIIEGNDEQENEMKTLTVRSKTHPEISFTAEGYIATGGGVDDLPLAGLYLSPGASRIAFPLAEWDVSDVGTPADE